jgi:hypothetical protein
MTQSINVLASPQFSVVKVLRPFANFEALYQGVTADRQIMCTEVLKGSGGEPRDDLAIRGTPGIDPNLVRGLAVPLGTRVVLWLPKIVPVVNPVGDTPIRYRWSIQWRLRNPFDYRNKRQPYHFPKQGEGVPDTSVPFAGTRTVIPACNQTIVYTEPEPTSVTGTVAQNMRIEDVTTGGEYPPSFITQGLPLMPPIGAGPTGIGAIQQGLADPATAGDGVALAAFYQWHEIAAVGDELLIGLWRTNPGTQPNWNFSGLSAIDEPVKAFLGQGPGFGEPRPDVGVLAFWGVTS